MKEIWLDYDQIYWINMKEYKCNTVLLLRINLPVYSGKTL